MKKRNIVIFTNTLLSGGAEKQALFLSITLKDIHNVFLVVYYGDKVEEKFRKIIAENKIQVVFLMGRHLKKMISLYQFLKKNNIDIIFSYLLTTNLIGAVIGKLAKVSVRVGGIRNSKLDKKKEPLQRFINNHLSTHTIFNNYDGLRQLEKKGFKTNSAIVIPNCFELNTEPIIRSEKETLSIITVGRFVHQKGYFDALKIIECLKKDGQKFKYYLIGFGELEKELREKIKSLQLDDVVEVLINPGNLLDYYVKSDIYLCTSHFEGLSNTIMEALSFSLPIVATDAGDNNRLVTNNLNGYLVDLGNYNFFISPLKKLLTSTKLRNDMGLESYHLIKNTYSKSAFKMNYENFISQLK